MIMKPIPAILCAFLTALMLSLGIPNELFREGFAPFGFVALIPLYLALRGTNSYPFAGVLSGLTVFLVHVMSSFWLAYFKDFAVFTLGASSVAYFFYALPVGWALRYSTRFPTLWRPFLFAAVWTLWEWLKSIGFLAYPWGTLVMTSFSVKPLIQIADLTGVWGIGFLLALASCVFAELLAPPPRTVGTSLTRDTLPRSIRNLLRIDPARAAVFTAALFFLAFGYGTFMLLAKHQPKTTMDTILVQNNADTWEDGGLRKNLRVCQQLTRRALSKGEPTADLVVWSESVLTRPYVENLPLYDRLPADDPFTGFMAETKTPLLVGSPVIISREPPLFSNSVILVGPSGDRLDWYAKIQLVPFAEYMPFTEYRWVREFFDTIVGFSSGWTPGTEIKTMSIVNHAGETVRFATPICFEDAFPSLCAALHNAGSDVLINLTNDSWSKTDSAEMQHFVIAAFRAVELRTTLVRSTNAGYTCVVDPTGTVVADLPLFAADAVRVDVPIYERRKTLYARFGDWFPSLLALTLAVTVIVTEINRRRR